MNFLELINKCLLELNYRQITSFSELIKNDHKRIVSILNVINKEVCHSENWRFLVRRMSITVPAKTTSVKNTVPGRIWYLIVDGQRYKYTEDVEPFLISKGLSNTYCVCGDNIFVPEFLHDKNVKIVYYSQNCAVDENDNEKEDLTNPSDSSLMPMPFAEQILVFGTCMRIKANPQHPKFPYWMSMYKEALLNFKSKSSTSVEAVPSVKMHRY